MSLWRVLFIITLILPIGCSHFDTGRTFLSEMERDDSGFYNPTDFPVVAGDNGKFWISEEERRARTPASLEDQKMDRMSRSLRMELRELEVTQSEENSQFYQLYKERLGSVSERIYFLKLPSWERKDYLMSRGIIEEPKPEPFNALQRSVAVQKNDILFGMTKNDVINSWGNPARVEVAGNPRNENERWLYQINGASKYIYFEAGQVHGWE